MADVKRMAKLLKLNKVEGTVVHHCALVVKYLTQKKIDARIIHGYCISPGEICEHYWVRVEPEGMDIDIGYELACLWSPELMALQTVLSEEFPVGLKGQDGKEPDVLRQDDNQRLLELYETDPKTFWFEAPMSVKAFSVAKFN